MPKILKDAQFQFWTSCGTIACAFALSACSDGSQMRPDESGSRSGNYDGEQAQVASDAPSLPSQLETLHALSGRTVLADPGITDGGSEVFYPNMTYRMIGAQSASGTYSVLNNRVCVESDTSWLTRCFEVFQQGENFYRSDPISRAFKPEGSLAPLVYEGDQNVKEPRSAPTRQAVI